jgi:hypothetical protein
VQNPAKYEDAVQKLNIAIAEYDQAILDVTATMVASAPF